MAKGDVFHALKHAHRQRILRALRRRPGTYSTLLEKVDPEGNGTGKFNYHLKVLKDAGLVEVDDGLYRTTPSGMAALQLLAQAPVGTAALPGRRVQLVATGSLVGIGVIVVLLLLTILFAPVVSNPPSSPFPRGWSDLALVSRSATEVYLHPSFDHGHNGPQVAVDAEGNTLAVWGQYEGGWGPQYELWSNRFDTGIGWGTPSQIHLEDPGGQHSYPSSIEHHYPRVAVDPEGNGVAIWQTLGPIRHGVWASRFVPDTGWGEPTRIDGLSGGASSAAYSGDVAIDSGGKATAVWQQMDGLESTIWANRFVPGPGWEGPMMIGEKGNYSDPRVAADAEGRVVAAWLGAGDGVYATRFEPEDGWGPSVLLGTGSLDPVSVPGTDRTFAPGFAYLPRAGLSVATNSEGVAVVAWQIRTEDGIRTYASHFEPVLGWGAPGPIGNGSIGYPSTPQVAMDRDGNALAVWLDLQWQEEWTGPDPQFYAEADLVASLFVPGVGWSNTTMIAEEVSGGQASGWYRTDFTLAMNPAGSAAVVWDDNGTYVNLYEPNQGWGSPALIGAGGNQPCSQCPPGASLDSEGNVVAAWEQVRFPGQGEPEWGIVAARFVKPTPLEEVVFGLEEELAENQEALEATSARLTDLTVRFLALLGLFAAMVAITGVLFFLYWSPRTRVAERDRVPHDGEDPPAKGGRAR